MKLVVFIGSAESRTTDIPGLKLHRTAPTAPCLAMVLKLQMPVVRELLSREEMEVSALSSDESCHGHM